MAEWLGRALQKLLQRFESARDLNKKSTLWVDFFRLLYCGFEQVRKRSERSERSFARECGHGYDYQQLAREPNDVVSSSTFGEAQAYRN